jgi:hypothetical protein
MLAFLDTVTDTFVKYDGTHVWDSWEDLSEYCEDQEFLDRVKGLCPEWFITGERVLDLDAPP